MTHASVFSGIGGPEVAATMLGWENLFHCEINPFGRAVLDYWYPNSKSYEDITKTDFTEWRGRVNVLTGGFPCQPFSYAGQRRGATDDRYLWPYMFRCIDQVRPDWVVAENVAGILTMVEQGEVSQVASQAALFDEGDAVRGYRLRETFTLQRICDDLESHGYAVQPVLIPACSVGAPHRRDRVFIVARRKEDTLSDTADLRRGSDDRDDRQERQGGTGWQHVPQGDTERRLRAGFGQAGNIRNVADTSEQPSERLRPEQPQDSRAQQEQSGRGGGEDGSQRDFADTYRKGLQKRREHERREMEEEGKAGMDNRTERPCSERTTADTDNLGQCGRCSEDRREWTDIAAAVMGELLGFAERPDGYEVGERWRNFPSVSPVHRGNDGLPFPVDGLTLPWVKWNPRDADRKRGNFSKWRTEALKAYGNAIVPQVMYEIFRAIEIVEQGITSHR